MYQCPFCDYEGNTIRSLRTHFRKCHAHLPCPICGIRWRNLTVHAQRLSAIDPLHATLWFLLSPKANTEKVAEFILSNGGFDSVRIERFVYRKGIIIVAKPYVLILYPWVFRSSVAVPWPVFDELACQRANRGEIYQYLRSVGVRVNKHSAGMIEDAYKMLLGFGQKEVVLNLAEYGNVLDF